MMEVMDKLHWSKFQVLYKISIFFPFFGNECGEKMRKRNSSVFVMIEYNTKWNCDGIAVCVCVYV